AVPAGRCGGNAVPCPCKASGFPDACAEVAGTVRAVLVAAAGVETTDPSARTVTVRTRRGSVDTLAGATDGGGFVCDGAAENCGAAVTVPAGMRSAELLCGIRLWSMGFSS